MSKVENDKIILEEDDGFEIKEKHIFEEDSEENIKKDRENIRKKVKKTGLIVGISLLGIIIISVIVLIVYNPKLAERILPFTIEETEESIGIIGDGDFKDEDIRLSYFENEITANTINSESLMDNPSAYANSILTVEPTDTINVIADVYVKDKMVGWLKVSVNDKEGYMKEANLIIDIEDTSDILFEGLTDDEIDLIENGPKNVAIVEDEKTEKSIKEQSDKEFIEEMKKMQEEYDSYLEQIELEQEAEEEIEIISYLPEVIEEDELD